MAGVHASTTRNLASARKSAVWLLQLAGAAMAILIQLALMAYMVYIPVTQPLDTWPLPIGVAVGLTVCLYALARLVTRRMDRADASK